MRLFRTAVGRMCLGAMVLEPPRLVVLASAANRTLWAEAINLGAYDVLAKPLDKTEVQQVVIRAWKSPSPVCQRVTVA